MELSKETKTEYPSGGVFERTPYGIAALKLGEIRGAGDAMQPLIQNILK